MSEKGSNRVVPEWVDCQIHHRDLNNKAVVEQLIIPLCNDLDATSRGVYFMPHWLHGPHLRVCVQLKESGDLASIESIVRTRAQPWLTQNAFQSGLDHTRLLETHRRLAELEQEPGPVFPIYPDGTIVVSAQSDRSTVMGSKAAWDLLRQFYVASNRFVLRLVCDTSDRASKLTTAMDLMLGTAGSCSGVPIEVGFVSFRSHAEAFLSWWDEADGLRSRWDAHYRQHSAKLTKRISQIARGVNSDFGRDSIAPATSLPWYFDQWRDILGPYMNEASRLMSTGDMTMDPPWAGTRDPNKVRWLAARSPWHNLPRPTDTPVDAAWFDRYRLGLNYTYLTMTRFGISPVERFLLCHLIANAVEDIFDIKASDVILPLEGNR